MQVYSQSIADPLIEKKKKRWKNSVIFFVLSFIFLGIGGHEPGPLNSLSGLSCCLSILFALSAMSIKPAKNVMVVQGPNQVVPQNITIQNNLPAQQIQQPSTQVEENVDWVSKAKNLEMARNWDEAAKAYEKAGLFAEAGRIRQEHMENSQPMVQIGQVGNTVLNDSVMIADNGKKNCNNCGNVCEATWNICPNCTNPL